MKVAVVHNLAAGGARRRMHEQLKYMSDHVVLEFCLDTAEPVSGNARVIPCAERAPRLARPLRPPLRYIDALNLERAWRKLWRACDAFGPDVLFVNPCRFLQTPPFLAHRTEQSLYYCDEPRRVDYDQSAAGSRNASTEGLYAPIYRRQRRLDADSARAASAVVTNSRFTTREITKAYGRTDVDVVSLGVPAEFAPLDVVHEAYVLSVGSLIPSKGHDVVIQAAGLAQTARPVRIVAPRDDVAEVSRLHGVATRSGVELQVEVGVSDAVLRERFAQAHATLYAARSEPFGLVSIESQACGTPVIVTNEGGLPETLVDGETGFAVGRSPEAFAAALDGLDETTRWAQMSAAAQRWSGRFSWEASGRAIETRLTALGR